MKSLVLVLALAALLGGCSSTGRDPLVKPSTVTGPPSPIEPSLLPSSKPKPHPTPTSSASSTPRAKPSPSPSPGETQGLPSSLLGAEWTLLPTSQKVVALTFDAGANDAAVQSILSTLASEGVPATFFLTGKWTELYPDEARDIATRYPVGNHSYDHPMLTELPDPDVRSEITRAADAIRSVTGHDPRPLFRFPLGDSDRRTIGIANSLGYGGIRWTADTAGWKGTSGGMTVDAIVDRVLAELQPGEIVLMHVGSNPDDGSTLDADALPRIIEEIRARGYGFVTVALYL